jgi:hypothetical protein
MPRLHRPKKAPTAKTVDLPAKRAKTAALVHEATSLMMRRTLRRIMSGEKPILALAGAGIDVAEIMLGAMRTIRKVRAAKKGKVPKNPSSAEEDVEESIEDLKRRMEE